MEYITEEAGYRIFKNSDGFLEGFRSTGVTQKGDNKNYAIANGLNRVVTTATTVKDFLEQIKRKAIRAPKYDPYKDDNQKQLFDE